MPTEKPRFCITVDNEMLEKIDDYRFEKRFNSRSAATVALIAIGLDVLRKSKQDEKSSNKDKD